MADALAQLPLKSLELPTKTVAKLKPLGLKTVADLVALRTYLAKPEALSHAPLLHQAAVLAARGLEPELAIALLARAFELDSSPELRRQTLDEPAFEPLRPAPHFAALFRGFPAFEARLRS